MIAENKANNTYIKSKSLYKEAYFYNRFITLATEVVAAI